jgi:hypothetical protein
MKHTNLMIAPIFIRSETLSLKRNSKKTASVIVGKTSRVIIALKKRRVYNYCIEKMSRVIIASSLKKTSRVILKKKTASVNLKEKKRRV